MTVQEFIDAIEEMSGLVGLDLSQFEVRLSLEADGWDIPYEPTFDHAAVVVGAGAVYLHSPMLKGLWNDSITNEQLERATKAAAA
jgi:hypothetical protein